MHDEIGGPGAGLGVNKIVDGVEGDGETIVLLLFSCSSVIFFSRLLIKAKTDRTGGGLTTALNYLIIQPGSVVLGN